MTYIHWIVELCIAGVLLSFALIGYEYGSDAHDGYLDCQEDEVYAWFGDFPDDVVWRCIPADDLTLN